MHDPITASLRDFIGRHLGSMDHVELLVRLAKAGSERWTAERAAQATNLSLPVTLKCLEELTASGLLTRTEAGEGVTFAYAPYDSGMRKMVVELTRLYNERPVTLVRAMYERPISPLISFSEAFRLKPPNT